MPASIPDAVLSDAADAMNLGTSQWEAAFWPGRYLAHSASIEHVPFAFWIVAATRPNSIVEVGIRSGVSYFAFCQAVEKLGLEARCCAIHAVAHDQADDGFDANVRSHNDDHYSSFSSMVGAEPVAAAGKFEDGSIDLLHFNLRNVAADAREVVEAWLPKMSPRGLVIVSSINAGDGHPGARAAYDYLKQHHRSFDFVHGGGLGVVVVGTQLGSTPEMAPPPAGEVLFRWRNVFARLGRGHLDRYLLDLEIRKRADDAALSVVPSSDRADADADLEHGPGSHGDRDETKNQPQASLEEIEELRSALRAEQNRLHAMMRENHRIKIALRVANEGAERLANAEKQVDALRNELATKATAATRMGSRIAALKEEIRRSDRYISQVLKHYDRQRQGIERRLTSAMKRRQADRDLEGIRKTVQRHERTPALKALVGGVRASLANDDTAARKAFYMHYRFRMGREDAADLALIAASGMFDPAYYLNRHEDVAKAKTDPLIHYMDHGAAEHREPSPQFDGHFYLEAYPDVAEQRINPLLHYLKRGRDEGRLPTRAPSIQAIMGDWAPPDPPPERVSRDALKPLPKRVVIFTAVSGNYDDLKPPPFRPPHCDFVVFSDQALEVEGWQVRPLHYFHPDPTRAARFVKLHPHLFFPDYQHSIWIDANIAVHGDIREFFRCLKDDQFVGIFVHPLRDCIYVEGEECIKRKKDDPEIINRHVAKYRDAGFPEKAGLWETNVVVRHHNDPRCIGLMQAWWREMETGSRRDQISLPVVAKRLSVQIAGLGPPKVDARNHPMLSLVKHPGRQVLDLDAALPPARRKRVALDAISMDIGVCVYNSLDETRACLESVARARRPQDGIIIVDDASAAPTAAYLDEFASTHDNVRLVRHEANRGYTASANSVLKNSVGDWVVLLNSDAAVGRKSLSKMIACGEQLPQIGIVGALSNAASWQTVPQLTGADGKFLVNQIPEHLTIDDMDKICGELSSGGPLLVPLINGFCYAIRRKLIDKIGHFDEEHFPKGYGEEDDFCLRAGEAGYLCAIATDAYVFHVKSATFTSDRRKPLVEAGVQAVRQKHTPERLKAAVETLKRNPELRRIRNRMAERLRELAPPLVPAVSSDSTL